ncbi:hypothetical protein MCC01992_04640 [Bifidobacteriaceae bacterium MCC01992]|nr:hypothetical protein MCC01992_04640 [Bifidobacteriaceae bacterium MCC01992]
MRRADWNERPAAPYGVAGFVIAPSIRREMRKLSFSHKSHRMAVHLEKHWRKLKENLRNRIRVMYS